MAKHDVKLSAGNPPNAAPYGQPVKKGDGTIPDDTVEWSFDNSTDWVVVFKDESPFERRYYDSNHPQTQQIMVDPGPAHYHYLVCVDGKIAHSPWIIVT